MKVTGVNGLVSRMAQLSRLWTDYDKLWDRGNTESHSELPDSASAPPQAQPQVALHNPRKGAAWLFRTFAARRPVVGARTRQRSAWRTTADKSATEAESIEGIAGVAESIADVTQSDASAIDIAIRVRNQRATYQRETFLRMLERQGTLAQPMGAGY